MEDRTLTLSKHEVVLDRMFAEDTWTLAFGADAWDNGYCDEEVYQKLKEYSNKALAWDKLFSMFECQPEQPKLNLFERERMIHILKEVEDE
tara:strand:+ start:1109 stop:1381 length:273 start_codon:yes stop_codon:yes gene_type:complete